MGSFIGFGLGCILQGPNIAAQTVLSKADAPIGLSIISLVNFLGSTIFVTIDQALIQSRLIKSLRPVFPDVDLSSLAQGDAISIRKLASSDQIPAVLSAYNDSLRSVWYLSLGLSCLVLLGSSGMEWKNVKAEKETDDGEDARLATEPNIAEGRDEKTRDLDVASKLNERF
jgi:hypothetical protein